MAKITIKGDTSGEVDIVAPAIAGTTTYNLSTAGGDILATGDIGTTVQGYDATILKSANIGSTVQGYDADTAKYDDATANFTGTLQNNGNNVLNTTSTLSSSNLSGALPAIDGSALTGISSGSGTLEAWINFNGFGTPTSRASGNVSSITDNGTGNYSINFSTSLSDANYCAIVTIPAENHYSVGIGTGGTPSNPTSQWTTTYFKTGVIRSQGGAVFDPIYVNIAIFR